MENKDKQAFAIRDPYSSEFIANGLTKREYFAAMAMQGLALHTGANPEGLAQYAIKLADELLKQLESK